MKNLDRRLYIFILMALGMTRGIAQTKTDADYARTMAHIAKIDNVIIDTVNITEKCPTYQMGNYDALGDKIHITHFAENYDTATIRLIYVLKAKKYIENTLAHEQTHRRNMQLFQRAIFKNIIENTQFFIYDEISARLAAIIRFREQMAAAYRNHNRIIVTDLLGREFDNIPTVFRKKIKPKNMYRRSFNTKQLSNDYYVYLTYLVNNPDVLAGPVGGAEFDYMMMAAMHSMDNDFNIYIKTFSDPYIKYPMYFNFRQLADLHDYVYEQILPNDATPARETFLWQYAPEWEKMGFDINGPAPDAQKIRNAARKAAAKFESGEHCAIMFPELMHEIFTFDGIDYIAQCTPETHRAISARINGYMKRICAEWMRNIQILEYRNSFLEAYWSDYIGVSRPFASPAMQMIRHAAGRPR